MSASSLIEAVRRHLPAADAPARAEVLRVVLAQGLTDPRDPRGVRHSLSSLVSVLVAGVACGYCSPLAIAGAAGWEQEGLVGHGCWRSPATGLLVAPSASTLTRLPALLDADEMEAALSAWMASDATDTSPQQLLAHARGHWRVEGLHWLRDVIWNEDNSLLRTGNAPQVMSTLTNLVSTLFRIQGVTKFAAETRRNAQNPSRALQLLALSPG